MIAQGTKKYETRSWAPPRRVIGHRIAIHAGVTRCAGYNEAARHFGLDPAALPYGAVLCTAVLATAHKCRDGQVPEAGMVRVVQSLEPAADPDLYVQHGVTEYGAGGRLPPRCYIRTDPYGDYSHGRWAWRLVDVRVQLHPVPARGRQGFWPWYDDDDTLCECCRAPIPLGTAVMTPDECYLCRTCAVALAAPDEREPIAEGDARYYRTGVDR